MTCQWSGGFLTPLRKRYDSLTCSYLCWGARRRRWRSVVQVALGGTDSALRCRWYSEVQMALGCAGGTQRYGWHSEVQMEPITELQVARCDGIWLWRALGTELQVTRCDGFGHSIHHFFSVNSYSPFRSQKLVDRYWPFHWWITIHQNSVETGR